MDQLKSRDKPAYVVSACLIEQDIRKGAPVDQEYLIATTPGPASNPRTTRASIRNKATKSLKARSSVTIGHRKDELRSTSWFVGLLRLPYLLSDYAVCMTAQVWFFRLAWPCTRYSISLKSILPHDSAFIKASAAGDVEQVRRLALSGQGTASSIDETGTPVLHVII